jgi:hypothetical protein
VRAFAYWAADNLTGALTVFDDMRRREPSMRFVNLFRMSVLARLGRNDEACQVAAETLDEDDRDAFAQMVTALRHALLGERESLLALMTGEFESYCWNDPEFPDMAAGCLALVGEKEKALDWLERWIDRGSINYPLLAHIDPFLEPLRHHLRFQRLLDRIKPEWEQFVPRFGPGSWDPVTPR